MDDGRLEQIWRQADRERGGRPVDLAYLVSAAGAHGSLTWRDIADLAVRDRRSQVGRPLFLLEFVAELAAALEARSILDPWVTAPTILAAADDASGSTRSCGLVGESQLFEIAEELTSIDWRAGDPFSLLDDLADESFELLLVSPPLGARGRYDLRTDEPLSKRAELADLVLWRCARYLASSGHLLFHTADNFLWAQSRRHIYDDLARRGIYLRAVVSVEGGLAPSISASTSLLFFGRKAQANLFVARLDRRTSIPVLVANLLACRPDDDPQLGSLTTWSSFRGWRSYVLEAELADLFGASEMQALAEVGSVRTVNLRPGQPYEPPPNCAFVPGVGFGPVTTSPPDLDGRRSYRLAEVQLNPMAAKAEYVAALLSSPLGKRLRESVATGDFVPHTPGVALGTLRIPIPSLAVQEKAIRAAAHIASMEAAISRLHSDLWRHPESAERVMARLEHESRADPVRRWTESLPYPLATVLQRYTAQRDPEQRVEAVLHFFEATAQFGCAVLSSIIYTVPDLLCAAQPRIAMAAPPGRTLFDRADFGFWINLGRTLAKAIRQFANNLDQRDRVSAAAEPAGELMDRFVNKDIWQALDSAREIRNQRAHAGVVSYDQINDWLGRLEVLVSQAEQALGNGFEAIDLAHADQGRFHKGIHTFIRAQRLRGPSDVFEEFELRTRVNIDSEHLVFVSRDLSVSQVLDVIPLVRLASPVGSRRKSCYFFESRRASDTFSYVSYHFEDQSQIQIVDHELSDIMRELAGVSS